MDKNIIKETMLSLEGAVLQSTREKYLDYVAHARLDRSEPIESDEQFVRDPDRNVIELRGREQGVVEGVTRYVP